MSVHLYTPNSDAYDRLAQVSNRSDEALSRLAGDRPVAKQWRPVKVRVDRAQRRGDFPSFLPGSVPAFSQRAVDVLLPLLGGAVEALPLECGRLKFYAIHVLDLVDCLDERRSTIRRFPSGGVMRIEKHVFDEKCLGERMIFRLREAPLKGVYYSGELKRHIEAAKLEGLEERQVFP